MNKKDFNTRPCHIAQAALELQPSCHSLPVSRITYRPGGHLIEKLARHSVAM